MTVATALVSGNDPLPHLAEDAVRQALEVLTPEQRTQVKKDLQQALN